MNKIFQIVLIVFVLIFGIRLSCSSQSSGSDYSPHEVKKDSIYTILDSMPTFPGGNVELFRWLSQNIVYPEDAQDEGVSGVVYVQFIVKKNGRISKIKILKGISTSCDKEVLRVIELMPNWHPGVKDGKYVKVQFTLPVKFTLT